MAQKGEEKMKLSILTATYNRGEYLKILYESILKNQEQEKRNRSRMDNCR